MSVTGPKIVRQEVDAPHAALELVVPEDLYYLQGHFAGRPILPGVVQIHWAIELAESVFGHMGAFSGIEAMKFHRTIEPLAVLSLELEHADAGGKLRFRYTSEQGIHSQGRVLFE